MKDAFEGTTVSEDKKQRKLRVQIEYQGLVQAACKYAKVYAEYRWE